MYNEMQGNDDFQLTFFTENLSDTDSTSEGGFTDFSECFHNDDTDVSECYTPIYEDYEASSRGVGVSWCDLVDDQFTGRSFLFAESDDGSVNGSVDGDQEIVAIKQDVGKEEGDQVDKAYKMEEEDEEDEEDEEFYDCLETVPEQLIAEWTRVRDSISSNGRSSRFTWYDDSDAEDDVYYFEGEPPLEPGTPQLSIGTFYDSSVVCYLHTSELPSGVLILGCVQETATVVLPTRAAVIDIPRRLSVSSARSIPIIRSRSDSIPLTPPPTPQDSNTKNLTIKTKRQCQPPILTDLRGLVAELETQLRNSSSVFLELNESFSETIGIPLATLKQLEEDVQSAMLPEVREWVRSGIWATVVTLHYLEFSGCKELAEKDPDFAEDYGYLCFCLNGPLLRTSNWVQSRFEGLALADLSRAAHDLFWTTE